MFKKSDTPPKNDAKHADDPKDAPPAGKKALEGDLSKSGFGPEDTKTNLAKENAMPKAGAPDQSPGASPDRSGQMETGKNTIGGLNVADPPLYGSPATGGPVGQATGNPPQQGDGTSKDVIDPSLTDKGAILDRMAAEHASLVTPEIHKRAARKADEANEHGAMTSPTAGPSDTLPADQGPRDIAREGIDSEYADFREVTIKAGSPAECDYVSEGDVVSHVNGASGEITFQIKKGSKSFTSVRARQVVKR